MVAFLADNKYQRSRERGVRSGNKVGNPDVQLERLRHASDSMITEFNPNYEFAGSTCTIRDMREIPREQITIDKYVQHFRKSMHRALQGKCIPNLSLPTRPPNTTFFVDFSSFPPLVWGIRLRQKPQAPTLQAPVRNRQTRKVANAKIRIG